MESEKLLPPFAIGDEVAVIPDCDDWASDWRDVRLWVAAVHAVPSGGFEFWVSDAWPLPDRPSLTDGFYMGVEDEPDSLALVASSTRPSASPEVERVSPVVRESFRKHFIHWKNTDWDAITREIIAALARQ